MTPLLTGVFASQISGHLEPPFTPSSSYDALAVYTVPSGGASTITFAGLPTGGQYKHLQIRYIVRNSLSLGYADGIFFYYNEDSSSTNYWRHSVQGEGSGGPGGFNSQALPIITYPAANQTASTFGAGIIDIYDYASSDKKKTAKCLEGFDLNGSGFALYRSFLWNNTSAINKITFDRAGYGFAEHSQIAIYGVKG